MSDQSFELVYFDPQQVHLKLEGENLAFTGGDGVLYPRVTLRRCFPLSSENVDIIVRTPESEQDSGHEIGIIRDYHELDQSSQDAIAHELKLFYFVPQILQVLKVKEEFGFLYWTALTDRGQKEFIMRDNIVASTRQISPRRWLLIDINQARYEIHDLETLDANSQQIINRSLLL